MTYTGLFVDADTPLSDSIRDCNLLMRCSTRLEKKHLINIYSALYCFIGSEDALVYGPEIRYPSPGSVSTRTDLAVALDSLVVGKILVELTEQAVGWEVDNGVFTPFTNA